MEHEIAADESVSMAVVRAVSALENREPGQLEPLGAVLDPDALDTIFDHHYDGSPRIGGHISFVYSHCRVAVDHGEYLTIEKLSTDSYSQSEDPGAS